MRMEHQDLPPDCAAPLAGCLVLVLLVAGLGFLGGYWLMQPRVIPNMGLAAYEPPPATRLIPLPRKMDAPELAELPPAPVEPVSAQPERSPASAEKATVAASAKPVARRPKARPQTGDDPMSAYAYRDRRGDHWDDRRGYGGRWDRSWASWGGGWNGRW
jgi:hypothetical protein